MNRYNVFLSLFILAIISFIVFFYFYLNAILTIIAQSHEHISQDPFEVFSNFFNPGILIAGLVLAFSSLAYRILGIVYVAKNKTASDGEKALWIIGFILFGFVTAIVFLILARSRHFLD